MPHLFHAFDKVSQLFDEGILLGDFDGSRGSADIEQGEGSISRAKLQGAAVGNDRKFHAEWIVFRVMPTARHNDRAGAFKREARFQPVDSMVQVHVAYCAYNRWFSI